jgi:uncharacterized protein (DUF1810 family)
MTNIDPFNLQRFVSAQDDDYDVALRELRRGRKESHWIWYIFPQVAGLGFSPVSQHYAVQSRDEAVAYLDHEILGPRLHECAKALLEIEQRNIDDVMGFPDNLKLQSSMTLFAAISSPDSDFQSVLDRYFGGQADEKTLEFLEHETG